MFRKLLTLLRRSYYLVIGLQESDNYRSPPMLVDLKMQSRDGYLCVMLRVDDDVFGWNLDGTQENAGRFVASLVEMAHEPALPLTMYLAAMVAEAVTAELNRLGCDVEVYQMHAGV